MKKSMKKKWALMIIMILFICGLLPIPDFSPPEAQARYHHGGGLLSGLIVGTAVGLCVGTTAASRPVVVAPTPPPTCHRYVCDHTESRWNPWGRYYENVCIFGHYEYYTCY